MVSILSFHLVRLCINELKVKKCLLILIELRHALNVFQLTFNCIGITMMCVSYLMTVPK